MVLQRIENSKANLFLRQRFATTRCSIKDHDRQGQPVLSTTADVARSIRSCLRLSSNHDKIHDISVKGDRGDRGIAAQIATKTAKTAAASG
jgi:hypothetical protein